MPDLLKTLLQRLNIQPPAEQPEPGLQDVLALRAQASLPDWKKSAIHGVENAGDFVKGLFADPAGSDFQTGSTAKKFGTMAAAAPFFAPKSIKGMFSRVENIAESLPATIHPNKLGTILRNRASQEEVGWRGLDKLMQGGG